MSSSIQKLVVMLVTLFIFSSIAKADIYLPTPQTTGGIGIFDALKKRASTSGGEFTPGKISNEELATILWAASGLNRGKHGWTVPMANGKPPYVKIYVAGEQGVYRYDWNSNALQEISQNDIRADIALQSFARRAAYSLIFVSDSQILAEFNKEGNANNFSQITVGAMSQNIYLAAAGLKLNVRYIHSIKPEIIQKELNLNEGDQPIGLMLLGK